MIHNGHTVAVIDDTTALEYAKRLGQINDNIASIYVDKAGRDVAHWRELMRAETWFSADEAVETGLADEVAGREAKTKNDFDLSVFSYAGRDKAPAPVVEDKQEEAPEEVSPGAGIDWTHLADALKGAFA